MTEENKNLVKEVFGHSNMVTNSGAATSTSTASESVNIMEELDHKEANEILLRASAKVINKYSLVKSHSSK